jgi:hypothetical protein
MSGARGAEPILAPSLVGGLDNPPQPSLIARGFSDPWGGDHDAQITPVAPLVRVASSYPLWPGRILGSDLAPIRGTQMD